MSRRACLVTVASALLLMAGCTTIHEIPASRRANLSPPASPSAEPTGGEALVAVPFPQTLFGPPLVDAEVQPGTIKLKGLIAQHPRLKVTALASSLGTVALGLQETSSGKQRWGEVMIPEERKLFRRFAEDPSVGNWLIVLTDVDVTDGPDAVPLVAYRWHREAVQAYAECGIPQSLSIEECTEAFYRAPEYIFLMHQSVQGGQ
jgi:hypothetical protein